MGPPPLPDPSPRRARRFARSQWFYVTLSLALALGTAGAYYYLRFTRLIDTALRAQTLQSAALYSRPYRIRVDQSLSLQALQERLDRLGYRRSGGETGDCYQIMENRIRIRRVDRRGKAEELTITFSAATGDQARVIAIHRGAAAVPEACLKPEFLSNLFGPSRTKKKYVRFRDLPQSLVRAVLAAEDEHFFSHHGLDLWALLRASLVNLANRKVLQGGSTLTQQFAKNQFLTPEKSLKRKLEELYLAFLLESRFTKEELFELYADEVYLGQVGSFGIAGFSQGADTYFGKDVKDLTLGESAFLAGLIQAPNHLSPYRDSWAAFQRRNHVLELMEKKGFITPQESAAARAAPLEVELQVRHNYAEAPYYVDYVKELLEANLVDAGHLADLQVYTTLDPDLQRAAFEAMQEGMAEVDSLLSHRGGALAPQAALVALDPRSGELLALIGGRDYATTQFNRAAYALRQPGSAFKPFVYATALQQSLDHPTPYTLSSLLEDEPYTFRFGSQEYSPRNYGGAYRGLVTLREALALSLNVPTVKLAQQIGFDALVDFAREVGLGEAAQPYPSIALGVFEVSLLALAQAYTLFPNLGDLPPLRAIEAFAQDGALREMPRDRPRPILRPEVAFLITSALEAVIDEGTGQTVRSRGFQLPAAGKTGTAADGWFVGYTPELLCAVWVGADDATPLQLTGAQAALPIWTAFMRRAQGLGYLSGQPFPIPENIAAVEIDPATGMRASPRCPQTRTEYYVAGTEPTRTCAVHGGVWSWIKGLFR